MKKLMLGIVAFALSGGALFAQNIAGTWQGTLQIPQRTLRIVFKVTRADNESLKAVMYSIDQPGPGINASAASQQGSTFKVTVAGIGGVYEGKLSSDGNTINGTWSQGGAPLPLVLERATTATEWAIPEPPPPPKKMAADAKPTFEVSTVKPSRPDVPGSSILVGPSGLFTTRNTTLADLISFAFGLHARQVVGGPSWMESEKYDITGKPDQPGMPSVTQLKSMVQKFIIERFQLTSHREKKELSVYAITVGKGGSKMAKNETGGPLPGFGGRGPGSIAVNNSSMAEFADFLQSRILDRPVVDQTDLTGKYDFTLKWTPDTPMSAAASSTAPPPPGNPDAPPDLFTAVLQQLGLKLAPTKAPVEVMVIDKVEKPTEN